MREVKIDKDFSSAVGSLVLTFSKLELTLLYAINAAKTGKGEKFSEDQFKKPYEKTLVGRWKVLIGELPREHTEVLEARFARRFEQLEKWRTLLVHFPVFPGRIKGTYQFLGFTRTGAYLKEPITAEDLRAIITEIATFDEDIGSFMSSICMPLIPITLEN